MTLSLTAVVKNRPIFPNSSFIPEFEVIGTTLDDGSIKGMCWQNDELRELNESYFTRHFGDYIAQRMDSKWVDGGDITTFCDEFKKLYSRWFFQPEGQQTSDENIYLVYGESIEFL